MNGRRWWWIPTIALRDGARGRGRFVDVWVKGFRSPSCNTTGPGVSVARKKVVDDTVDKAMGQNHRRFPSVPSPLGAPCGFDPTGLWRSVHPAETAEYHLDQLVPTPPTFCKDVLRPCNLGSKTSKVVQRSERTGRANSGTETKIKRKTLLFEHPFSSPPCLLRKPPKGPSRILTSALVRF